MPVNIEWLLFMYRNFPEATHKSIGKEVGLAPQTIGDLLEKHLDVEERYELARVKKRYARMQNLERKN